jgi:hypothetical protein
MFLCGIFFLYYLMSSSSPPPSPTGSAGSAALLGIMHEDDGSLLDLYGEWDGEEDEEPNRRLAHTKKHCLDLRNSRGNGKRVFDEDKHEQKKVTSHRYIL